MTEGLTPAAEDAIEALGHAGLRVAVAESVTGGLVSASLTDIPGASAVFPGGVVTYEVAAKIAVLGVSADLLATRGPVDPTVAIQMAVGVARLMQAQIGVATTGVAGPEPHGGHPPGAVFVGWATSSRRGAIEARLAGPRGQIRHDAAEAALLSITQCAESGAVSAADLGTGAEFWDRE